MCIICVINDVSLNVYLLKECLFYALDDGRSFWQILFEIIAIRCDDLRLTASMNPHVDDHRAAPHVHHR